MDETRLDELAEAIKTLRDVLTYEMGATSAMSCAIDGILASVGHLPGVGESVTHHMEQFYARQLGGCTNQQAVDAFAERAELLTMLITPAPEAPNMAGAHCFDYMARSL